MHTGGCVNTVPDILEKVESEVGSLAGSLAAMDFIGERAQEKIRNLIYWDLPKLIKEHKKLRAISFRTADAVEYEYGLLWTHKTLGVELEIQEWFSTFEQANKQLQDYTVRNDEYLAGGGVTYYHRSVVKRRKAGKVERV